MRLTLRLFCGCSGKCCRTDKYWAGAGGRPAVLHAEVCRHGSMGFCLADGKTRILDMSSSERHGAHALELLLFVHTLTLPMIGASTLTRTLTLILTGTQAFVLTPAHIRTCTFAEALTRHMTLMFTLKKHSYSDRTRNLHGSASGSLLV